jgi:hypothetical protein
MGYSKKDLSMSNTLVTTVITSTPIFGSVIYATGEYTATYTPAGVLVSVTGNIEVEDPVTHAFTDFTVDSSVSTNGSQYVADFTSATGAITNLQLVWNTETPSTYTGTSSPPLSYVTESGTTDTMSAAHTGTLLNFVACYCAGTRIRTPDGDVAVGSLVAGQMVVTASGEVKPIRWIGKRVINVRQHADPAMVRPIRIAAGALAEGMPKRDLLVSPDHAMLVDGALIPARLLVNHRSVTEMMETKTVTYFHVELDRHDIIIANGAPAESYLDTGNRDVFTDATDSAADVDFSVGERLRATAVGMCMTLVTDPEAVFPIWQRIADRAGLEVYESIETTGDNGGIRLIAGSRTLRPVVAEGDRVIFALPHDATDVRLVSFAAQPNKARPWLDDRRELGVAVKAISADHTAVALDGPALTTGWWDVEHAGTTAFRWTSGDAVFALPKGTKLLTVRLHAVMPEDDQVVFARAA